MFGPEREQNIQHWQLFVFVLVEMFPVYFFGFINVFFRKIYFFNFVFEYA
jgi:hypothetical protein